MRFKVLSKLKVQALAAHALLSRTVRVLQILSAFYIWSFCSASSLLCLSCGTFYFRFCLLLLWLLQFLFFSLYPLSLPLSLLSKISYICCRNNAWKLVHSWPTFLVVQWETERKKERGGSERTRKAEEWICCSFGSCRAKATTKKKSRYIHRHTVYIRLVPKTATKCGAAYRGGGRYRMWLLCGLVSGSLFFSLFEGEILHEMFMGENA